MITFYGLIVRCKLFIGRSCKWVGSEGYLCICANKKAWTVIERMKRNGNREERREKERAIMKQVLEEIEKERTLHRHKMIM